MMMMYARITAALVALVFGIAGSAGGAGAQTDTLSPTTGLTSVAQQRTVQAAKILRDAGFSVKTPDIVRVTLTPKGCVSNTCRRTVSAHNARVNAGAQYVANQIGNTALVGTNVADFIALSSDTGAVNATDTTCPSELVTSGMSRKIAAFVYTSSPSTLGGSATYTLTNSYTATGAYTINKLCLFTLVSAGTMLFETLLGAGVSGSTGDVINVVWTVNE